MHSDTRAQLWCRLLCWCLAPLSFLVSFLVSFAFLSHWSPSQSAGVHLAAALHSHFQAGAARGTARRQPAKAKEADVCFTESLRVKYRGVYVRGSKSVELQGRLWPWAKVVTGNRSPGTCDPCCDRRYSSSSTVCVLCLCALYDQYERHE